MGMKLTGWLWVCGWSEVGFLRTGFVEVLLNGFALGRQAADVGANEFFQIAFALDQEVAANAGKLVGSVLRHLEGELLHVFAIDQHTSSGLYFSWLTLHSQGVISERIPT